MNFRMPSKNRTHFLCAILIVIAGVVCYFNTISSPFVFDDNHAVVENQHLRSWSKFTGGMNLSNRRYLTNLTFFINYQIGKNNPSGYHIVNTTIHIATGLTVYWLTYLLLGFASKRNTNSRSITNSVSTALFAQDQYIHIISLIVALLFVVHPLQTQAVTYIVQRATSLSGLLYLLTLALYSKAFLKRDSKFFLFWYFGALITCVIGMFTKENFYTAPIAILLCEVIFFRKERASFLQSLRHVVPFLMTMTILPYLLYLDTSPENHAALGASVTHSIGRYEYFLTQFRSFGIYAKLLFYPVGQRVEYSIPKATSLLESDILIGIIIVAGLAVAAILYLRKNALFSFGIVFALLALSVESSFIPLPDLAFEHRMYLPLYGILIALLSIIVPFITKLNKQRFAGGVVSLIIIALAVTTITRNRVWGSVESLWQDAIEKEPLLPRPHLGLGQAYASSGRLTEALLEFKKSLSLGNPTDEVTYNIGLIHTHLQSPLDSVRYWMERTILSNNSPSLIPSTNHLLSGEQVVTSNDIAALKVLYLSPVKRRAVEQLISVYNSVGNPAMSAAIGERVVAAFPQKYCSLYNDLGVYQLKLGNYTRALYNLDMARQCGFSVAQEFYNLVSLYAKQQQKQ